MSAPIPARKPLISVHIPKTAGTSLTVEIRRGTLGRHFLDYDDMPTSRLWRHRLRRFRTGLDARLHAAQLLRDYDVLHGHFRVAKYAFLYPRANFITFMREPVSRLLSHFYYFKHVASKNPVTVGRNPDVARVASGELGLVDFARGDNMRHLYASFTDGLPLERFALIGITERYTESVTWLNHRFGTMLEPRHERRSDYERYAAEYEPLLPELHEANRENARLYAEALKLFEQALRD